jgi:autotransporter-associated beta strand protein
VTNITLNGGTLNTAVSSDNGWGTTINMTGGTLGSTVSGGYFAIGNGNGGLGGVFNIYATNVPSVISADLTMRQNPPYAMVFNVARGTSAADLDVTGSIRVQSSGGVVKSGTGIMKLDGANTYTGATVVSNGTLVVNGSLVAASYVTNTATGTLAGTGTIAGPVWNYGTLAPGAGAVGTLATGPAYFYGGSTINFKVASADTNNNAGRDFVNINGTLYLDWLTNGVATIKLVSMQNSNTVGSVPDFNPASNYSWTVGKATSVSTGGNLGVLNNLHLDASAFSNTHSGTFALAFDATTYELKVNYTAGGSSVNTTPAPLAFTVMGNSLHLSWPADHLGWKLQYQTNSLTSGLGTNWITVPGSDTITSTNITVDPSKPTVFYRMVYP